MESKFTGGLLGLIGINILRVLLIAITLYYACFLMMSNFTLSQVQKPSQFIFKLFF